MSPLREVRNPITARRLAAAAALSAAVSVSLTAHAGYHVTAFGDAAGFDEIMAADYRAADAALNAPRYERFGFAVHSNRCVAELKMNERGEALSSCERAVVTAPNDLGSVPPRAARKRLVLAHLYSNRGVARAVNGDMYGAREDFERALSLDPGNANARRNLQKAGELELAQRSD